MQNPNPNVVVGAIKIEFRGVHNPGRTSNGLQHDTRPNGPTDDVAAPKQNLSSGLFQRFLLTPDEF
jgi:hypothetical protein